MAESIALGMRLATADELATVAGIEGEISVTEGEWRAVVHDGVTKGGYPLAKLAEAGQLLTKSEDGTKLQLKNKDGLVLSETDAPSSNTIHVGDDEPTDENATIWVDTDENQELEVSKDDIVNALGYTPLQTAPVTSVNGKTGAVTIDAYTLPTATSSTLGGVKIGSNITVSSGTISLTKSNVTSALGYTPLQTAPVTSVNGQTGAVTVSTITGNAGTATKLATSRTISLTGDATGSVSFDGSGDVSIDVTVSGGGGDTSTLIPKTGDRGSLAGFDQCYEVTADGTAESITIDENSPDNMFVSQKNDGSIALTFTSTSDVHYIKNIVLFFNDATKITTTFEGVSFVSNYLSNGYVNELTLADSPVRLVVVCDDGWTVVHEKPVIE